MQIKNRVIYVENPALGEGTIIDIKEENKDPFCVEWDHTYGKNDLKVDWYKRGQIDLVPI